MAQVKATDAGIRQITDQLGASTFYGISVSGHCMGIVGRTWRDPTQSSGYAYAIDGANACRRAGVMRTSTPQRGGVVWWDTGGGGRPGHVATIDKAGSTIGNVGSTIQRRALDSWSFWRIGWCWPGDVPGWSSTPAPPDPDPGPDPESGDAEITEGEDMLIQAPTKAWYILTGGKIVNIDAQTASNMRSVGVPTFAATSASWSNIVKVYGG